MCSIGWTEIAFHLRVLLLTGAMSVTYGAVLMLPLTPWFASIVDWQSGPLAYLILVGTATLFSFLTDLLIPPISRSFTFTKGWLYSKIGYLYFRHQASKLCPPPPDISARWAPPTTESPLDESLLPSIEWDSDSSASGSDI